MKAKCEEILSHYGLENNNLFYDICNCYLNGKQPREIEKSFNKLKFVYKNIQKEHISLEFICILTILGLEYYRDESFFNSFELEETNTVEDIPVALYTTENSLLQIKNLIKNNSRGEMVFYLDESIEFRRADNTSLEKIITCLLYIRLNGDNKMGNEKTSLFNFMYEVFNTLKLLDYIMVYYNTLKKIL